MRTADLMLRYTVIIAAWHLACAWIQTFQEPWPLVDAFELADNAEEQLFRSLGVRFDASVYGYNPIRLVSMFTKAFGSLTLMPIARARFVPSSVRTSTGCFATSHMSAW